MLIKIAFVLTSVCCRYLYYFTRLFKNHEEFCKIFESLRINNDSS